MEVKEKKEKKSRALEFLVKEHKYENLILAVLAIVAIELGVLLLTGVLEIPSGAFLIGQSETASTIFSWLLVVLGAVSLVLSVISFFIPSFVPYLFCLLYFSKYFFAFSWAVNVGSRGIFTSSFV